MMRGLYAITPDMADTAALLAKVEQALKAGVALLQYRNKIISKDKRLLQAHELAPLARGYGVPLIVNDDVEIALSVGANGVHLGKDDGDLAARARQALRQDPRRLVLRPTCESRAGRGRAPAPTTWPSAACSPRPPSPTRCARPSPCFRASLGVPLCAIGGITLENAPQLIAAGADLLAVISDLFDAPT